MAGKLEVEGKEILIKSSNGTMAVIPKDKVSMVKSHIASGNHGMVDKFVNTLKEFKHDNQKAGDGLYANIHAKRQRIAAGSGERMRKPGEAGAPTAGQFKQAAKTAKAGDGMKISPMSKTNQKTADIKPLISSKTVNNMNNQKAVDGKKIVPLKKPVPTPPSSGPTKKVLVAPNPNRATTQDSLDVFNQQNKVDDYYKKKNYELVNTDKTRVSNNSSFNKALDKDYDDFVTSKYPTTILVNKKTVDVNKDSLKDQYRKIKNKNQLYQRESSALILDTKAPTPLYDRRIKPQFEKTYVNKDKNDPLFNDSINLMTYDPIAVKPLSMMTPAERKIREERYPESIPKKPTPIPVKPKIAVPEKLEPKDASFQSTKTEKTDDRKVKMRPVPMPVKKPSPALQYPAMKQNFLQKIKSIITGKKPREYWTDKQGEKHYPHLGESNSEEVKKIKMLKSGLNPLIPEDAAELKRINSLLKMNSKDRLNNIVPKAENGMVVNNYKAMLSGSLPSKTKK